MRTSKVKTVRERVSKLFSKIDKNGEEKPILKSINEIAEAVDTLTASEREEIKEIITLKIASRVITNPRILKRVLSLEKKYA